MSTARAPITPRRTASPSPRPTWSPPTGVGWRSSHCTRPPRLPNSSGAFADRKGGPMNRTNRRAVCLDRDGTVIYDAGYPRDPRRVQLLPGAGAALDELKRQGFLVVLISNQSGIGRGLLTRDEAEQVHRQVVSALAEFGVHFDAAYYCPHAPKERCRCRKPSPQMLLRAAEELDFELARSFMVGDKPTDIAARN